MREFAARSFQDYGRPLEMVSHFKYLGRILTAYDDNWSAVVRNLRKTRKSWARL